MFIKKTIWLALISLIVFTGCPREKKQNLDWSVSEDRTTVYGIVDCDCLEVDIEMLVTDENTGEEHWSTFTVASGRRFEHPVGIGSDFTSIDLSVIEVR